MKPWTAGLALGRPAKSGHGAAHRYRAGWPRTHGVEDLRAAPARCKVALRVIPWLLLAVAFAAGCSAGAPVPPRATVNTCYAFGVRALERHLTVLTVPRSCAGLSREEVDLAVVRAIRSVIGPLPKAAARRMAVQDSGYLAHLVRAVPVPRPAALSTAPPRRPSDLVAEFAALAAWLVTAAAGTYLVAGWLATTPAPLRLRRSRGLPGVVIGHLVLAVAGLAVWVAFIVSGVAALAWVAVGVILLVAGLGMATLMAALPESVGSLPPGSTGRSALATQITHALAPVKPARPPVLVIAVHGIFATVAILLVLLAAIGAG